MALPRLERHITPPEAVAGHAAVRIVENHIFCLELTGFLSEGVAQLGLMRARDLLQGRRVRTAVADTTGATGTQISAQGPVRDFVALTRDHGVQEVYCAAISPAMRLLGSAVALATGVRIQFFSTVDAAWAGARAAERRSALSGSVEKG